MGSINLQSMLFSSNTLIVDKQESLMLPLCPLKINKSSLLTVVSENSGDLLPTNRILFMIYL
jgi:hypothetical protein